MIVGANGYVGRNLLRHLTESKFDVLSVSSSSPGGIDPATGLLPYDFVVPHDVDVVYFLSQSPHYRDLPARVDHVLSVNVLAAVRAARAATDAGVKKFIYTSTGNVYAPSFSPLGETDPLRRDNWYSLSKIHAEEALALFNGEMAVTITRLFGVYGPGQKNRLIPNLVESISIGKAIRLEGRPGHPADDSGMQLSLCYIEDLVTILRELGQRPSPSVVNVASGAVASVRGIATMAGKLLGRKPKFVHGKKNREFDLIADTMLLRSMVDFHMTPIEEGLCHLCAMFKVND